MDFLPLACTCVSVVLSASRTKPDADGRDLSSLQRTAKWLGSALWAQICSLNLWVWASDVTTSLWSIQSWKGMRDDENLNQIGFLYALLVSYKSISSSFIGQNSTLNKLIFLQIVQTSGSNSKRLFLWHPFSKFLPQKVLLSWDVVFDLVRSVSVSVFVK